MNRVNITINSRIYTVVADEDTEYLKSLCDYVNEKVNAVIAEGVHVMNDKPVVLAALNICDEYFKLLNSRVEIEKMPSDLLAENERLEGVIRDYQKKVKELHENITGLTEELELSNKMIDEEEQQLKTLTDELHEKDELIKRMKSDFAIKQRELLNMLETKSKLK